MINLPPLHELAIFCDFDGTLVPIAPTPDAIRVPGELDTIIRRLHQRLDGAVALITGRALADLSRYVDIAELTAAGCHGAEWQMAPDYLRREHAWAAAHIAPVTRATAPFTEFHQLIVEDKRYSLAIHFRNAPHLETELDAYLEETVPLNERLKIIRGKCVREIKPVGIDKGTAITQLMESAPFRNRQPLFIGDDTTDEDGFRCVNRFGGISIKVGSGDTAARHRLPDCADVIRLLRGIADPA